MAETELQAEAPKEFPLELKPEVQSNGVRYRDEAVIKELAGDLDRVIEGGHAAFKRAVDAQAKEELKKQETKKEEPNAEPKTAEDQARTAALKAKLQKKIKEKRDPAAATADNLMRLEVSVREAMKVNLDLVASHNRQIAVINGLSERISAMEKAIAQFVAAITSTKP